MGKGAKTETSATQTLDPEIKARLFKSNDDVNRWTSGVLNDGSSSAPAPQQSFYGGYGGLGFNGGFDQSYYPGATGQPSEPDPDAWKAPDSFIAGHTDTTNQFLDAARNPGTTGADFRKLAGQFQDTPEFNWQGGQAAQAQLADYGDTPEVRAKRALDFMGDYEGGYTNSVVDSSLEALKRRYGKNMQQSQMSQTAAGAGAGNAMRQGIADAEVRTEHLLNSGLLESQLRDQGWTRALGAGQQDAGRALQADSMTAQMQAQRLASMFAAQNAMNENNAARDQSQSMFDQSGVYNAGLDSESARIAGLTGATGAMNNSALVDIQNNAMLGTAAGIDQSLADRQAGEPLEMLKLRMASTGMLPNLVNTTGTSEVTPGLFDWAGLGFSALS
jgi:hypothetical protein